MMTGQNSEIYFYTPATSQTQGVLRGNVSGDTQTSSDLNVASLGEDDFLKLLIAQMQNQDPLNPASNTEFVAQLAQFSTLEQLTTMNSNLEESLIFNQSVTESINNSMMVNFIGKSVSAESNEFLFDRLNSVDLQFELDQDILQGTIEILDNDGSVVRTISLDTMTAGLRSVTWDGLTNLGVSAESGNYSYSVTVYDMVGNEQEASPVFTGIVEGISYKDGTTHLDINGMLVPFDKVTHIIETTE